MIPSEAIEGLMKKAFMEASASPGLFWDALLKANLFVPVSGKLESTDIEFEDLPLMLGVDSKGNNVILLFTSPAVLTEYLEKEYNYKELPAAAVFVALEGSRYDVVLIGPESLTLKLHSELVKSLAKGEAPEPPNSDIRYIAKESNLLVGAPKASPALEACFRQVFEELPNVLEAAMVQIEDERGSRLLLGIHLVEESRERLKELTQLIARAAEGILEKGEEIDITFLNGSLEEAFKKWGKAVFKRPD